MVAAPSARLPATALPATTANPAVVTAAAAPAVATAGTTAAAVATAGAADVVDVAHENGTWFGLPPELQMLVLCHLGLHDMLSLRATSRRCHYMLSDEMFDREIWSADTAEEARKLVININRIYGTTRTHPILDIEARWNTPAFCASALEHGDERDGWRVLAWARANGCPWSRDVKSSVRMLTVPDGVAKLLPDCIFRECVSLVSVVLPAGIVHLPKMAFYKCPELKYIYLPPGLAGVGDDCFHDCPSLPSISLPHSVTTLGHRAFMWCTQLASVELWEGLFSVGDDCFRKCTTMPSMRLPDSVRNLGHRVFMECPALKSVTAPRQLRIMGENPFYGCSSLTDVIVPDEITGSIRLKLNAVVADQKRALARGEEHVEILW